MTPFCTNATNLFLFYLVLIVHFFIVVRYLATRCYK
uniref:Uncharacterized protein n=1 Tax=Arundo donax TaxID=35708 RepID=A0A0A9H7J4_ARUDO